MEVFQGKLISIGIISIFVLMVTPLVARAIFGLFRGQGKVERGADIDKMIASKKRSLQLQSGLPVVSEAPTSGARPTDIDQVYSTNSPEKKFLNSLEWGGIEYDPHIKEILKRYGVAQIPRKILFEGLQLIKKTPTYWSSAFKKSPYSIIELEMLALMRGVLERSTQGRDSLPFKKNRKFNDLSILWWFSKYSNREQEFWKALVRYQKDCVQSFRSSPGHIDSILFTRFRTKNAQSKELTSIQSIHSPISKIIDLPRVRFAKESAKDYWMLVLNLDLKDLKKSYRQVALKLHPDRVDLKDLPKQTHEEIKKRYSEVFACASECYQQLK